jgi:D-serine deaminase-like pyridoxal phosphate-dependent protein
MSSTIEELETPEVLVDREQLLANIARAQKIAEAHGLRLRPHVKTHKCVEIAQLQLANGASGLTASKVDEALVFIDAGITQSLTLAYPVVDRRKLDRLFGSAARKSVDVRLTVDSSAGIDAAAAAAKSAGLPVSVFVKIDVGLHRCGLAENSGDLLDLIGRIGADAHLRFAGLLSHAGHAYAAQNPEEIAAIAADEVCTLQRVRERIEAANIAVPEVSVGSTPTVLAGRSFAGVTEIRPGNYVFLDATAVRLGIARTENVALNVLATVISANAQHFIVDAGSKVLSSDLGAHGTAAPGYGLAYPVEIDGTNALKVVRLSEEHGFVKRGEIDLPIGAKLRIIPNHSCPVANLAERLTIVSRGDVVDQWRVAARAKVR